MCVVWCVMVVPVVVCVCVLCARCGRCSGGDVCVWCVMWTVMWWWCVYAYRCARMYVLCDDLCMYNVWSMVLCGV